MKKIKNWTKNSSGITLIALVITIIVLLILAGVSLSLIMGNDGILGRAENAVNEHTNASIEEEIQLAIADLTMAYYEGEDVNAGETLNAYIQRKLAGYKTASGEIVATGNAGEFNYKGVTVKYDVVTGKVEIEGSTSTGGSTSTLSEMYSVSGITANDIADSKMFDIEPITTQVGALGTVELGEVAQNKARITGVNSAYIASTDDNYYKINVGDTLVIPYEVNIDGTMYEITEVNLKTETKKIDPNSGNLCIAKFPGVKTIIYPNSVTTISVLPNTKIAVYPTGVLEEVVLSNNLKEIPQAMFTWEKNLKTITIPKSVTSIGEYAFNDCTALTTINYTGSQEEWEKITVGDSNSYLTQKQPIVNYTGTTVAQKYSVIYNANGGSGAPLTERYAQGAIVKPSFAPAPTKDGYRFLGWVTSADATTPTYTSTGTNTFTMSATDVTLYAVWGEALSIQSQVNLRLGELKLAYNNGDDVSKLLYYYGDVYAQTSQTETLSHYLKRKIVGEMADGAVITRKGYSVFDYTDSLGNVSKIYIDETGNAEVTEDYSVIFYYDTSGTIYGIKPEYIGYPGNGLPNLGEEKSLYYYVSPDYENNYLEPMSGFYAGWCILNKEIDTLVVPSEINGVKIKKVDNIGAVNVKRIVVESGIEQINNICSYLEASPYSNSLYNGAPKEYQLLKEVILPGSVTKLGYGTLQDCSPIQNVYFEHYESLPIAINYNYSALANIIHKSKNYGSITFFFRNNMVASQFQYDADNNYYTSTNYSW